jgi:putative membrane protein
VITSPPPARALPGGRWQRLHPLSPLVRIGGVLVAVPFVLFASLGNARDTRNSGGPNTALYVWIGLAVVAMLGGFVSWLVTRWRIHEGDLQIEMGLIRRQSFRIPLERIQAIDVVAPLAARILGLAEVRVVSAGRGAERGRLAYLSATEAPQVRAQLLALAHGLAPETPEPLAYHLARIDNSRLAMGLVLRGAVLAPVALFVIALTVVTFWPRAGASLAGSAFSLGLIMLIGVFRRFNDDFNFSIGESGDGLRLDRGLLQRRHETIPYGRIQAVRLVEPLLWRPLGWCRIDVDVARQHVRRGNDRDANQVARTLIPIASREVALWLLWRVLPGARMDPPPGAAPPSRARVKAPLSYHFLAAWYDDTYVCARTGRLQAATVVVPLDKIQSVRLSSGPVQRVLRLATVHVDTAGRRWQASAHCRDQGEADAMLWQIAERAEHARRRVSPAATVRH